MNQNRKTLSILKNPAIWLGIIAAILYSSWPLGYLLNSHIAHTAYASQLEATNQPYNWLFIILDLMSGSALIIVGLIQWGKSRSLMAKLSIGSYMVFAGLVIVAALVPFNCNSLNSSCIDAVHSPLVIVHGLASIVSVSTLFISMLLIGKQLAGKQVPYKIKLLPLFLVFCWSLLGIIAYVNYHRADENLVQYGFISVCSLSALISIALIEHLLYLPSNKASKEGLRFGYKKAES